MVKLKTCISLCPLTDQNSFLGLSEDSSPESIIVTLGTNVVLRTKITNLQQLKSWNIRDQLTAPVVFDKYGQRYIGIFNFTTLKIWTDGYEEAKKYKFATKLHSVLTRDEAECILVFSNGNVQSTSQAISSRREELNPILKSNEHILHTTMASNFVVIFTSTHSKQKEQCTKLYLVPLLDSEKSVTIELTENNEKDKFLISHCVIPTEFEATLVTLWSDGNIFSSKISLQSPEFPGMFVMNIKTLNTQLPVAMQSISPNLLVLYGCDPGEEGALLLVVDTKLRSIVCRHYFKMYTKPPRLWVIRSNILLSMGQYLALVPFHMTSQLLDSLIMTQIPDDATTKTFHWENENKQNEQPVTFESYEEKFSNILNKKNKEEKELIKMLENSATVPDTCILDCIGVYLALPPNPTSILLEKILLFPPPKCSKYKNKFDFKNSVEFLLRILETDYALFNHHTCSWITCIVDAYYHRFLLCEDRIIHDLLKQLQSIVKKEVDTLLELTAIKPKLEQKTRKKRDDSDNSLCSSRKMYSYGVIKLY